MNDYPHLLTCAGADIQTVVEAVCTRYADGPFRKPDDPEAPYRQIMVGTLNSGDVVVWESKGGLTPGPCRVEIEIRDRIPDARLEDRNKMWPGECPPLASTHVRLAYDIDDDRNRAEFEGYVERLPGVVARMFPVVHDGCGAKIEWLDGWVEGPEPEEYEEGMFRYSSYLVALLALRSGDEIWREEHVTLANFPAITPAGTFINRRHTKKFAMDDFGQQLLNLLGRFAVNQFEREFNEVSADQLPTLGLQDLYEAS